MQKVLVLTGTTDITRSESATDNKMEDVFNLTLPSKINYVKKNGYDLLALRSFGSDKNKRYEDREIGFLRAVRVFEALDNYEYVMWLDADALVTNPEMKISDFQIDNSIFYCSYDWMGNTSLNTGNFIMKNTKHTKEFINAFYELSKKYNFPEEQYTFNVMYRHTEYGQSMKVLDHKYLNAVPSIEMYTKKVWGNRPAPTNPWQKGDFLLHVTGIANSERIAIMNDHFNEYLCQNLI